ncbi:hypothetical protein FEM48_Zijuj01G0261700 [Ziziphus jujuba var. spinosa]|uniref:GDSL esterase/lipase 1-like n=1 Tax=Ziziphus jujuba var. spinosa TaxID=714518 RepID=A0A978W4X7_ZIZJJ|nr:hypothetical protein FEM48_Zijuj01G0261700 [Ziziphus jujuba var. spinosa]
MAKLNLINICLFVFCISLFNIQTKCFDESSWLYKKQAALFIFGDSQFDAGNNNYINTTTGKANYWPYGETFFHYPTGRFCDGRLVPDFIVQYAKLPFIPPYLPPRNKLFINGVNFASAGAGALAETRKGSVIDLETQLGYFKNISRVLKEKLGDTEAEALISKAVYLFSVGGNDYSFPFETNSSVLYTYSVEQFVGQVIGNITQVIKEIYEVGGRKFGFPSMWPLGCFKEGKVACCGSGPYRGILSCGGRRGVTEYYLCDNVNEYVFFDSSHPTERAYKLLAQLAWSGEPSVTGSYNLKALFES